MQGAGMFAAREGYRYLDATFNDERLLDRSRRLDWPGRKIAGLVAMDIAIR
jgi:hypothetical protein